MALSPEWQLVLACAKTHLTPEDLSDIEHHLVRSSMDWNHLAEQACYHGVAPLLYDNLQQANATGVLPNEALGILQSAYHAIALRNAFLYRALGQVLQALKAAAIPVVVLKGAALADTVYLHRALRPMSDIDLLIDTVEIPQVEKLLRDTGYALKPHHQPKAWQRTHHYHWTFIRPDDPAISPPVELHWHIERPTSTFRIDLAGLWDRAVAVNLAGVDALMFASEDMLLHLCLHTCRHAGSPISGGMLNFRLRSFCDMAEVIRHAGASMDWEALVRRAHEWRAQPYVYLSLQLARELLGAAMPTSVLDDLKPEGFDARLLGWARAELLQEQSAWPIFADLLTLWNGRLLKDRAAVVAKILSLEVIAESYALPPASKKVYLYYPRRLKDLLTRYGPVLWRLLSHNPQLTALAHGKSQLANWLALGWPKPH